jgi:hypothetical protein
MYRFGFVEFYSPFFVQIASLLTADCSFLVEISTVSPIAMTAVSSANVAMVLFDVVGTSLYKVDIRLAPVDFPVEHQP